MPALDHPDVCQAPLDDIFHLGIICITDPGNFGHVPGQEFRIGVRRPVFLPDMDEAVDIPHIPAWHVDLVIYGQSGDSLPLPFSCQPCLVFVYGEPFSSDDPLELHHERAVLLIHVVLATEGDVVGISRIPESETLREPGKPPVQAAAHDVGKGRRGGRSLRENVLPFCGSLRGCSLLSTSRHHIIQIRTTESGKDRGDLLREIERGSLQDGPDAGLGDAREEILQVRVEDIVHPHMDAGVTDDRPARDKPLYARWGVIERLEDPVGDLLKGLQHPMGRRYRSPASGPLRDGECLVMIPVPAGVAEMEHLLHGEWMRTESVFLPFHPVEKEKKVFERHETRAFLYYQVVPDHCG